MLQPNYRGSAGYGDAVAAAERLPELADLDRRHHRRRALARRAGHRRSEPDGDRRLVLWRLCGAPVGRDRAGPVQGDRRDRAGHRSPAGEGRFPRLYQLPQRRRIYRQRPAYRARARRSATSRAITRAGAAVPRRPRPQRQRHPFAADGRGAARRRQAERADRRSRASSTTSPIRGAGADAAADRRLPRGRICRRAERKKKAAPAGSRLRSLRIAPVSANRIRRPDWAPCAPDRALRRASAPG